MFMLFFFRFFLIYCWDFLRSYVFGTEDIFYIESGFQWFCWFQLNKNIETPLHCSS